MRHVLLGRVAQAPLRTFELARHPAGPRRGPARFRHSADGGRHVRQRVSGSAGQGPHRGAGGGRADRSPAQPRHPRRAGHDLGVRDRADQDQLDRGPPGAGRC
ncbi:hypothetical protein ACFSTC_43925 [Nonomuraea ferruginea]